MSGSCSVIVMSTLLGICMLGCGSEAERGEATQIRLCQSDADCFEVAQAEGQRHPSTRGGIVRGYPGRMRFLFKIPAGPTSRAFLHEYSRHFLLDKVNSTDGRGRGLAEMLLILKDGTIQELDARKVDERMVILLSVEVHQMSSRDPSDLETE